MGSCQTKTGSCYSAVLCGRSYKVRSAVSRVCQLQAVFRGYFYRKNILYHSSTSDVRQSTNESRKITRHLRIISDSQIKQIKSQYDTSYLEKNPSIDQISQIVPNFELNEKEEFIIKYTTVKQQQKKFVIIYKDGSVYNGTVNDEFKRDGIGKYYMSNGDIYEGFFLNNQMEGRGRLLSPKGYGYLGDFKNSVPCGYGNKYTLDNHIFKGTWNNNVLQGLGEEYSPDGSYYAGNFEGGKKNGYGKFSFVDGSSFYGFFVDGEIIGEGIYKWKDGRMYEGIWKKNQMNGYGIFCWPDKKKYYGEYKNNAKDGLGKFIWPDGKIFEGFWKEGKQSGFGYTEEKGYKLFGEWDEGVLLRTIASRPEVERIEKLIEAEKEKPPFIEFLNKMRNYEDDLGII